MQESECKSTLVIYIPIEKYKYIVITESDTILQEYYISKGYKYNLQGNIHNQKLKGAHEQQEESREPIRRRAGRKGLRVSTTLSLHHSDLLRRFCYAPRSKIWTYEFRVVRCNPTSGNVNAK